MDLIINISIIYLSLFFLIMFRKVYLFIFRQKEPTKGGAFRSTRRAAASQSKVSNPGYLEDTASEGSDSPGRAVGDLDLGEAASYLGDLGDLEESACDPLHGRADTRSEGSDSLGSSVGDLEETASEGGDREAASTFGSDSRGSAVGDLDLGEAGRRVVEAAARGGDSLGTAKKPSFGPGSANAVDDLYSSIYMNNPFTQIDTDTSGCGTEPDPNSDGDVSLGLQRSPPVTRRGEADTWTAKQPPFGWTDGSYPREASTAEQRATLWSSVTDGRLSDSPLRSSGPQSGPKSMGKGWVETLGQNFIPLFSGGDFREAAFDHGGLRNRTYKKNRYG